MPENIAHRLQLSHTFEKMVQLDSAELNRQINIILIEYKYDFDLAISSVKGYRDAAISKGDKDSFEEAQKYHAIMNQLIRMKDDDKNFYVD